MRLLRQILTLYIFADIAGAAQAAALSWEAKYILVQQSVHSLYPGIVNEDALLSYCHKPKIK